MPANADSVLTTGGADRSIFQWRYHADGAQPDVASGYQSHEEQVRRRGDQKSRCIGGAKAGYGKNQIGQQP